MQLTTALHLVCLIVPVVVLAVLNVMAVDPSPALLGALAALSSYAGASTVLGFTKDRLVLRQTPGLTKHTGPEPDAPKRWSQEAPVSKRSQRTGGQ